MKKQCWSRPSADGRKKAEARQLLEESLMVLKFEMESAASSSSTPSAFWLVPGHVNFSSWQMTFMRVHPRGDEAHLSHASSHDAEADLPEVENDDIYVDIDAFATFMNFRFKYHLSLLRMCSGQEELPDREMKAGLVQVRALQPPVQLWAGTDNDGEIPGGRLRRARPNACSRRPTADAGAAKAKAAKLRRRGRATGAAGEGTEAEPLDLLLLTQLGDGEQIVDTQQFEDPHPTLDYDI